MSFDIKEYFPVLTFLISVIGIWRGYIEYKIKSDLEIFEKYTKRYHEILDKSILLEWNLALHGNDIVLQDKHKLVMVNYLNLVWEEYYLFTHNILPNRLWDMWVDEINVVISTEFARGVIVEFRIKFPDKLSSSLRAKFLAIFRGGVG